MKKIKTIIILTFFLVLTLFFTGCSTLSYDGTDYVADNVQTVTTSENFIFETYKKTIDNVNCKIGISKTPIPEILAMYVQIENLSYDNPYVFKVDDLRVRNVDNEIPFITSSNYLNIYQTSEASSLAAMSSLSSTITNMTGMMANYNDINQQTLQNSAQESNNDAFSKMQEMGNKILKHTIRYSSTISPRKSQYFYFFFENQEKFPITIRYKNLNYQFKL